MNLTTEAVTLALPRLATGLSKYLDLQRRLHGTHVSGDRDFQRAFNGFYRVRRDTAWQEVFYDLLEREKGERRGFEPVLRELQTRLGRYEASFASKLTASVDPTLPVIDAFVLKNMGLRLPAPTSRDRLGAIVDTHRRVADGYSRLLASDDGQAVVASFDAAYSESGLTDLKKLDLVLWQIR